MQFTEARKITTADPATVGADIYCEDWRLSLRSPGAEITCLVVSEGQVTPLSPLDIEFVIDFCSSFVNIEDNGAKSTAAKNAWWSLDQSKGRAAGKRALQDAQRQVVKEKRTRSRESTAASSAAPTDSDVWGLLNP